MALGGGVFTTQNKKLPGAYINFVSAARASATVSDRGIAALAIQSSWGEAGKVITLTSDDLIYNSRRILGYDYSDAALVSLREVFKHARQVLIYRLNTSATKATNKFCDAKYGGVRGNDLKIVITANADESSNFDVKTLLGTVEVDVQTNISSTTDNLVDNDFVVWKSGVALELTASTPLASGTDGTVQSADWQTALGAFEAESFNTFGAPTSDDAIKSLVIAWTKRMRDEVGVKFQSVVYNKAADDKAIINLVTKPTGGNEYDAVYWTTGAQAGCKVNESCTNMTYDGELTLDVSKTQAQLETCIESGEFVFHKVGEEVRVLTDINSKVTVSEEEGEDFKSNQTMRVVDQIGNDIATLFNTKYLGKVPNNNSGRISLWNDIVKHHNDLQTMGAIEDFDSENVVVTQGDTKKSVVVSDAVTPVNAMEILYMTCVIS